MALAYLKELYIRILFCVYTFCGSFLSIFYYREEFLYWYSKSVWSLVKDGSFIFTGISEVFLSYLSLSLVLSIYIFLGMCCINIYFYILPGLYKSEAKNLVKSSCIFFIIFSCIFIKIHFVGVKILCSYLLDYRVFEGLQGLSINFEPRLKEFLYFLYKLDFIFFLVLLLLFVALMFINLSSRKKVSIVLLKWRKIFYFVVLSIILIFFPADMLLHLLVFTFIIILFESSCFSLCILKSSKFAWWNW